MLRRRAAAALAGLLCLAGPSLIQGGSIRGASAQEMAGTLKAVKEAGAITLGYRESSIPFSFLNVRKHPIGYSMDLCQAIVEEAQTELAQDLTVKFKPVTSESRIPALLAGEIDLECGSTTNNTARQKQVAFSPIFFVAGTKLMVKKTSAVHSYRDLRDKTVVVTAGTTNEAAIRTLSDKQQLGIKILTARDHAESFSFLAAGKADAFATDDVLLYGLLATSKSGADYEVVGDYLSYDPYGLMYRKDDPDFAAIVERTFKRLAETREIAQMYEKWFLQKLPTGERLELPMSPHLETLLHMIGLPEE
jgi:glutamate/aspartate transport system substrate-binding protein